MAAAMMLAGAAGCEPTLDPGPVPSPYALEIRTWYDLHAVRDHLDRSYVLMNDLDANTAGYDQLAGPTANRGQGWQPIGTSEARFTGSFDGQGYQIRDLSINRPDEGFVGLLGAVDAGAVIRNLGVTNAAVTGEWAVGILTGGNWGGIEDSYSAGSVNGYDCVGGLAGGNAGSVSSCYSTASVTGRWDVGGLVGCNDPGATVSKSYAAGGVIGEWSVGGLVGGNLGGTVSRSYAAAGVSGDDYVGGLVGDNQGSVGNCYSTGSVNGQWYVGGLVGWNDPGGSVNNCYSVGSVSGDWHAGGLVGENDGGTVGNSFWDTQASGVSDSDGGTGKATAAMQAMDDFLQLVPPQVEDDKGAAPQRVSSLRAISGLTVLRPAWHSCMRAPGE